MAVHTAQVHFLDHNKNKGIGPAFVLIRQCLCNDDYRRILCVFCKSRLLILAYDLIPVLPGTFGCTASENILLRLRKYIRNIVHITFFILTHDDHIHLAVIGCLRFPDLTFQKITVIHSLHIIHVRAHKKLLHIFTSCHCGYYGCHVLEELIKLIIYLIERLSLSHGKVIHKNTFGHCHIDGAYGYREKYKADGHCYYDLKYQAVSMYLSSHILFLTLLR